MTAEVGILNRMGVALAADSAVTIGSNLNQKVYNSANKLFSLSKHHPIGIMVYGSAHFMGVPWETIIKEYRKQLGTTKFNKIEEYCDSFFSYIQTNLQLRAQYAEDTQVKSVFHSYLSEIINNVDDEIAHYYPEEVPSPEIVENFLNDKIDKLLEIFSGLPILEGFSDQFIEEFKIKHQENINSVLVHNIYIDLQDNTLRKFLELAAIMFSREITSDKISGIVIAGYGELEIFPTMCEFETEGMFCDVVKISTRNLTKIGAEPSSEHTTASIRAFAQKEMVQAFMNGIDPNMERAINNALHESLINKYPKEVEKALETEFTPEQLEIIRKIGEGFNEGYLRELDRIQKEKYIYPIVDTVDLLPKEELAAMAEALVNLTSFKRKVTIDAETVGGPIDVAVISKGDGFVWIKRKHYFRPELNYHFFQNYLRGEFNETNGDI